MDVAAGRGTDEPPGIAVLHLGVARPQGTYYGSGIPLGAQPDGLVRASALREPERGLRLVRAYEAGATSDRVRAAAILLQLGRLYPSINHASVYALRVGTAADASPSGTIIDRLRASPFLRELSFDADDYAVWDLHADAVAAAPGLPRAGRGYALLPAHDLFGCPFDPARCLLRRGYANQRRILLGAARALGLGAQPLGGAFDASVFECNSCCFATQSLREADAHARAWRHMLREVRALTGLVDDRLFAVVERPRLDSKKRSRAALAEQSSTTLRLLCFLCNSHCRATLYNGGVEGEPVVLDAEYSASWLFAPVPPGAPESKRLGPAFDARSHARPERLTLLD